MQPHEFVLCGYVLNLDGTSAFLTLITAVGALLTAWAAWRSTVAARQAAQGQLLFLFLSEYATSEMEQCLKDLGRMERSLSPDEEIAREAIFQSDEEPGKSAERARRPVKQFFFKAQRLYNAGYVDKVFMREIIGLAGFGLMFSVIESMEAELGLITEDSKIIYDQLRKMKSMA